MRAIHQQRHFSTIFKVDENKAAKKIFSACAKLSRIKAALMIKIIKIPENGASLQRYELRSKSHTSIIAVQSPFMRCSNRDMCIVAPKHPLLPCTYWRRLHFLHFLISYYSNLPGNCKQMVNSKKNPTIYHTQTKRTTQRDYLIKICHCSLGVKCPR